MWLKKCTCFLLACVAVFGCLFTFAIRNNSSYTVNVFGFVNY